MSSSAKVNWCKPSQMLIGSVSHPAADNPYLSGTCIALGEVLRDYECKMQKRKPVYVGWCRALQNAVQSGSDSPPHFAPG